MPSTQSEVTAIPRRYAVVGTGWRAGMYIDAMLTTQADVAVPVAWCDPNDVRMTYYDELLAQHGLTAARYAPDDFERLLDEQRPDVVVVASPDHTHARYVTATLNRGIDVVCEKPLTTDVVGLRAITDAARRSSGELIVTFNYRYSPRNREVRKLVADGAIGQVTSVHFEWLLDTVHGADYFRRWHRDKASSGGLLVHKSTHHFDLVNWWIADVPEVVYALGGLRFYGSERATARGLGPRPPLGRDLAAGDPFALDMARDDTLRRLYLEAEGSDGYVRDRDVFSEGITIEDNLSLVVGYRGGPSMTYSLNAHCPWEGYRVAINGTEGRLELDVVERSHVGAGTTEQMLGPDGKKAPVVDPSSVHDDAGAAPSRAVRPFGSRLRLQRHWEAAQLVEIPEGAGAHGGGDAILLDDVFRGPGVDPLGRQAHFLDGVRSVIVGVGANESLVTGRPVHLDRLGVDLDAGPLPLSPPRPIEDRNPDVPRRPAPPFATGALTHE
jgi:predicted dehydrogenase